LKSPRERQRAQSKEIGVRTIAVPTLLILASSGIVARPARPRRMHASSAATRSACMSNYAGPICKTEHMHEVLAAQAINAAAERPRRACHPTVNLRE